MNNPDGKPNPARGTAPDPAQSLRNRAEEKLRTRDDLQPEALGPEETRRLLHELRVHQIELEMQNEELRRSQEEREASRVRYVELYDFAPVGYITVSEQGLIREANLTAATLLGMARGALVRQPLTRFILPEDQDIHYHLRRQLFENGEPQIRELRLLRTDSPPFWARLEATAARDGENGPPVYRVVMSDITEPKRAEEALRKSEENFRRSFDDSPLGVRIVNVEGATIYANRAILDIYGCGSIEELKSTPVAKRYTPASLAEHQIRREKRRRGEYVPSEYEINIVRKDGEVRHLQVFRKEILWDGEMQFQVIYQDITASKQAEEALRQSEEAFRSLFDDHAAVKVVIDPDTGAILTANHAAVAFYGWSRETLAQMNVQQINTLPLGEVKEAMRDARDRKRTHFEFQHRLADGSVRDVEVFSSGVTIHGHGYLHSIIHDITDRKQAEAEKAKLEAQYRQLQKTESLGRMAGAIAHNFNNLLGAVLGNLELAMLDLPRGSDVGGKLTGAIKAARKASEVSGLMLTYLGQTPGRHEPLDLSEACRRSLPMLRAAMPKEVDLEVDLPSPGPTIKANAHQLQQVLTNLATNAWESFGEGRGAIHLTVKTVSPADIPATRRYPLDWQPQDNLYACLEVTDAGCGIEEKDIERLFDPFFTSKFTGRGLGLSVVLGIVRAHYGAVTVESEADRGSVLRVFLPVSAEAVPRPPEKAAQAPEIEEGGTVLLVEDEQMVRDMAKAMLTHLGFAVLEAKDGIEAVEVFRQHKDAISCVLCDLTMPRMDGWETLAALRKLAPGIPVILTSGYDQAQVMAGDHPEWPQAFLGKPYRLTGLCDAIRQTLEKKQGG